MGILHRRKSGDSDIYISMHGLRCGAFHRYGIKSLILHAFTAPDICFQTYTSGAWVALLICTLLDKLIAAL